MTSSQDRKTKFVSLMTYAKEGDVKSILADKSDQLAHAFYIPHDKDEATPHIHIVVELVQSRKPSEIAKWFKRCTNDEGQAQNTFAEPVRSCAAIADYLTHSGEGQETKHQYTQEDIRISKGNIDDFKASKTEAERHIAAAEKAEAKADETEQLLDDIINGVPSRQMARKYGRDYMRNHKTYKEFAAMVVIEEEGDFEKAFRLMGAGFDQHIAEEKHRSESEGYKTGVNMFANAMAKYLSAEIGNGATYLNDTLQFVQEIKKGINT